MTGCTVTWVSISVELVLWELNFLSVILVSAVWKLHEFIVTACLQNFQPWMMVAKLLRRMMGTGFSTGLW